MKTKNFRQLQVWQRSMTLAQAIYEATKFFPKAELFGMTSQMRRAAVSVPSNIAEGQGRLTDKHFALFLAQARGSLFELQTQIELSHSLAYLDAAGRDRLIGECVEITRMLHALLNVLQESRAATGLNNPAVRFSS
jgi:four helix bundle protein